MPGPGGCAAATLDSTDRLEPLTCWDMAAALLKCDVHILPSKPLCSHTRVTGVVQRVSAGSLGVPTGCGILVSQGWQGGPAGVWAPGAAGYSPELWLVC